MIKSLLKKVVSFLFLFGVYGTVTAQTPIIIEAEEFTESKNYSIQRFPEGFSGKGAIASDSINASVTWTIDAPQGTYKLVFRYVHNKAARNTSIIVNGNTTGNLSFPSTGGYGPLFYKDMEYTSAISLNAGKNTIMLQAVDGKGPIIDKLSFMAAGTSSSIIALNNSQFKKGSSAGLFISGGKSPTILSNNPEGGLQKVNLYSLQGKLVKTLFEGTAQGYYNVNFNASTVNAGIYLVELTTNNKRIASKITINR